MAIGCRAITDGNVVSVLNIIGLKDGMVMQRGADDTAQVIFTCDQKIQSVSCTAADQPVPAAVTRTGGQPDDGWFRYTLTGIPVGGPYALTIHGAEQTRVFSELYVGDVWLLAGQSNMEGVGIMTQEDIAYSQAPDQDVRALYMTDVWGPATVLLHQTWKAVDKVHTVVLNAKAENFNRLQVTDRMGVGPGLSFGRSMKEWLGVPQGLICCAHGGTSLIQWDPAGRDEGGDKRLYGAMYRRFIANGAHVRGLFWYQGCSETNEDGIAQFDARMKRFIEHVREDFGPIPMVQVQLGRLITVYDSPELAAQVDREWAAVREKQRLLSLRIPHMETVAAIPFRIEDGIHLTSGSQAIVGRNAAEAMAALLQSGAGRRGGCVQNRTPRPLGGIRVASVTTGPHRLGDFLSEVTVTFTNVHGALHAEPEPRGFMAFRNGEPLDSVVINTRLEGNQAILSVHVSPERIAYGQISLAYGYGRNPCCNIVDEAGYALPAFGPIPCSP